MATNRTRAMRTRAGKELLQSERHLLLTGECTPPEGDWRDYGEGWLRPFTLVSPAGREELRELWEANKEEIMATWTGDGLPWAAQEFEENEISKERTDNE